MENLSVVSLFSGAMGLDLGLELQGFETIAAAESDEHCRKTILTNRPAIKIFDDVRHVVGDVLPKNVTLVAGGPPCQPFSTAGKRLSFEFGRIVKEVMPRFFVMENVKGLTFAKAGNDSNGSALKMILDEFSAIGYKLIYHVLDAVNFGVPQFRERLIVVGTRDNEPIFMPAPTHFQTHQDKNYRWRTLGNAIQHLENSPGNFIEFSESRKKWLEMIGPGGNWKMLPKEFQREAIGNAVDSGGGKTGFLRRLTYSEPSPTLVTCPSQNSTLLCHPTKIRPLSISEYMAIQQFPENWKLAGKLADQYRQIGNAVPLGLGSAIGMMLKSVISKDATVDAKRVRGGQAKQSKKPVPQSDWLAAERE